MRRHTLGFSRIRSIRSSRPEVLCKKGVLTNFIKFTVKNMCQSLFIEKKTLTQVFFCQLFKIFNNIYFYRTPLVADSEAWKVVLSAQLHKSVISIL